MQKELQILSLNIAHGMFADDLLAYIESKMTSVSVFCLQEVSGKILRDLNTLLGEDFVGYYAEKETNQENTYYGLATYVNRRLLVLEAQPILQHLDGPGLALSCTIQGALDQTITVTSLHGAPRPGHKLDTADRIMQSEDILQSLQRNTTFNIVMGDFNLLPETHSIKLFEQYNYRNLIDEYAIYTTRNEAAWSKFPSHMKQLYADYAFIQASGSMHYDFEVEDNTVSDHLPLQLTLTAVPMRQKTADLEFAAATQEQPL